MMDMIPDLSGFDEAFYLRTYPDIGHAIAAGDFVSGYAHYIKHGRAEGRLPNATALPKSAPADFDEVWYLEQYADIAAAVRAGNFRSAFDHWTRIGKLEGRLPPPGYSEGATFDADWYGKVYHAAVQDIAAGRAEDFHDHYLKLGRFRGYLPNSLAPRPDSPAGFRSHFGGLWVDQANAADLIEGKRELGQISADDAALLHDWRRQGYVILRNAVPAEVVDRAAAVVRRVYAGEIDPVRFECFALGGYAPLPWGAAVRDKPAKALDLHWLFEEIRDLVFNPRLRAFLELLFERRALATQSLTFLRGSAQGYHQDTIYVPYTLPTQFVASWVALEDVQPGGGELTYFPGSQQLPDMLFAGQFKTLADAQRMLRRNSIRDEMEGYSARLERMALEAGLTPERFMAKKGDVLFWHADLAHGGLPISNAATRMSVLTHYCPKEIASMTFERGRTAVRSYKDQAWYATGYYAES